MLIMCGCTGKSGGGWSHYVGQEKLRPQKTGWQPLAFALDWHRQPRHMNGTSFFYNHSSQWRYERLEVDGILSPLADKKQWENYSMIDCNVRSEKIGCGCLQHHRHWLFNNYYCKRLVLKKMPPIRKRKLISY